LNKGDKPDDDMLSTMDAVIASVAKGFKG
jgi:hypothetical protein